MDTKLAVVNEEEIDRVLAEIKKTILRKNADYGDAWQGHGLAGVLISISHKGLRLERLASGHEALVVDEKIYDTILDAAGYSVLGMIYINALERSEEVQQGS